MGTHTGKIKFFRKSNGFGFITMANGEDIFVHAKGCKTEPKQDDDVEFDIEDSKKGKIAVNVTIV